MSLEIEKWQKNKKKMKTNVRESELAVKKITNVEQVRVRVL